MTNSRLNEKLNGQEKINTTDIDPDFVRLVHLFERELPLKIKKIERSLLNKLNAKQNPTT